MDWMLTLMQTAALATAGMVHALLGSVKVPLARKLEIDEARVGGLVSVFGFTLIPMVLAAGFLVDAFGKQAVLGLGFVLVSTSLVVLAQLSTFRVAVIAVLVLGSGWSALVNVLNVLSPPAFLTAEELAAGNRTAFAMNMGDFIFGMGAFITPLLLAFLIRKIGLNRSFYSLVVPAVAALLLGLGVDWENLGAPNPAPKVEAAVEGGGEPASAGAEAEAEEEKAAASAEPAPSKTVVEGLVTLLSDSIVWLCCLAFFCHVPVEASVAAWATTLMMDKGVTESRASTFLSIFWLAFMGSRLITAIFLPVGADEILVVAMAVLCIVFTTGLVLSRGPELTCILVVVAGLVLGPIFPTLIAMLFDHVSDIDANLLGRAVGLFFCIGGIGWTAIPVLIGAYAKRTSVQRSFVITIFSASLLTALSLALAFRLAESTDSAQPVDLDKFGSKSASVRNIGVS